MRLRLARLVVVLMPAVVLSGCVGTTSQAMYMSYRLTCCLASDIETAWTPGTSVELHLVAAPPEVTTANGSHTVRISAVLSGPYADADALKAGGAVANAIDGYPVVYDDRTPPPDNSVITFVLPADLGAGLYNLVVTSDLGRGSSISSATIVHVGS